MKKSKYVLFGWLLIFVCNIFTLAQNLPKKEIKIPNKIDDGFVVEFNAPFNQIQIDSDEKIFQSNEITTILIGTQTKILNSKGKPIESSAIKSGMQVDIKLEPTTSIETLIANTIKLKSNNAEQVEVKGFLDKVTEDEAFISGNPVILTPNISIKGKDDWKTQTFANFQTIPLGAIIEIKATKREDGRTYASSAEVKPNKLTVNDLRLIELARTGLVIPPAGQEGSGIKIGNTTYKLSQNLALNQYVTKVGYKVVPRYIKNQVDGDPNKILFRFYVLEDDTPNAMAMADGSVFVHTGLLKLIENEAQLAYILAHEIGHVTNEHTRREMEAAQNRALWIGLAGAAAGAAVGQQMGVLIAQIGYGILSNKYSRKLENEADRIGMFYAYDAGYDVREASKVWRRMMGEKYNENKVGTFLYSDHPSLLSRLKNTKREFIINYPDAKFDESIIGREKYLEVVGVYFGWIQPKVVNNNFQGKANTSANVSTAKNKSKKTQTVKNNGAGSRPKIKNSTNQSAVKQNNNVDSPTDNVSSVIDFVVKETKKNGVLKGTVYCSITLGINHYIVSIKTGKIVKKEKNKSKEPDFYGDYAIIGTNLMNSKFQEIVQGSGWLLKKKDNSWELVATAEGEYMCDNLRTVPSDVIRAFKIECF
jgi:hypothetical protein